MSGHSLVCLRLGSTQHVLEAGLNTTCPFVPASLLACAQHPSSSECVRITRLVCAPVCALFYLLPLRLPRPTDEQLPPLILPCRKRYATTYLVTDVLACIPFGCIMVTANPSLNYYNAFEVFK